MRIQRTERRGLSLIEILIVIAIFGVLVGLLLAGVQRVRRAALLVESKNNLRQIIIGVHQVADQQEGTIPDLTRSSMKGLTFVRSDHSLFYRILPYVHGPLEYRPDMSTEQVFDFISPAVKAYRNPADPSWNYDPGLQMVRGKCSYALNMMALDGSLSLVASLPDGSSNTIAVADKYFARANSTNTLAQTENIYTHIFDPFEGEIYGKRRATFADRGWQDVMPVTDPVSHTTRPSIPGKTFQVAPRPEDVDPSIPQTPFQAGLTVAMFDGSVRTISPGVSETTFWAMVTPNAGDIISD
jgi:prepilin-type N-terminal cleavage/methylation domain-containing protein